MYSDKKALSGLYKSFNNRWFLKFGRLQCAGLVARTVGKRLGSLSHERLSLWQEDKENLFACAGPGLG